jgi:hypothetical protein
MAFDALPGIYCWYKSSPFLRFCGTFYILQSFKYNESFIKSVLHVFRPKKFVQSNKITINKIFHFNCVGCTDIYIDFDFSELIHVWYTQDFARFRTSLDQDWRCCSLPMYYRCTHDICVPCTPGTVCTLPMLPSI